MIITTFGGLVKEKEKVTSEGRLEAEVDVLLAVETHDEAGHVDHLELGS